MPHFKTNSFVSGLWIYFQGSGFLEDGDLSQRLAEPHVGPIVGELSAWQVSECSQGPTRSGGLDSITMNPCLKSGDAGSEAQCYNTCLWFLSSGWLVQAKQANPQKILSSQAESQPWWAGSSWTILPAFPQFPLKLALSLFWEFLVNTGKVLWPKVL